MKGARGPALVATAFFFLSLACGGGDGDAGGRLLVIDQNILHGILDEDPAAQPYDRAGERFQVLAEALAEVEPDVIFLQEVLTQAEEDYPEVRSILLDALGDEYASVFSNIQGDAIDTGGLGQLTLTRLAIEASENRHIGGVRSVHHVRVRTGAGPVDLYNVHLEGTGAVTEAGEDASLVEMDALLAFIEETRSGGPVILGGDFNAEPDDPAIQRLLDEGYVDVLAQAGVAICKRAGDPGCTNSTIPLGDNAENGADRRIDYIFVLPGDGVAVDVTEAGLFLNEPVELEDSGLLWASDHIGVQAVLELREESRRP